MISDARHREPEQRELCTACVCDRAAWSTTDSDDRIVRLHHVLERVCWFADPRMIVMKVRPLDTLLAAKVLALAPDLNANDRRVATTLIEHFNRRNSVCDPGQDRIAQLLGISTRTVIRS